MILNIKNSKIVNFLLNVHKETRAEKIYAYQIQNFNCVINLNKA